MTAEHKIMTIFKYLTIRLIIFFKQKTGTVEEIQKTEDKSKTVFVYFLRDFLSDLQKKKSLF